MREYLYQFHLETFFDRTANQIHFSRPNFWTIIYSINSIRYFRATQRWKIYTSYTLIFEKYLRRNTLLKAKLSEDNFVIFLIVQILKGCVFIKF